MRRFQLLYLMKTWYELQKGFAKKQLLLRKL